MSTRCCMPLDRLVFYFLLPTRSVGPHCCKYPSPFSLFLCFLQLHSPSIPFISAKYIPPLYLQHTLLKRPVVFLWAKATLFSKDATTNRLHMLKSIFSCSH